MLFKECGSLDEAMSRARHVDRKGRVVQLIEGDDGTHVVKQEIVAALKHPESRARIVSDLIADPHHHLSTFP
jgi:hypothetical protein